MQTDHAPINLELLPLFDNESNMLRRMEMWGVTLNTIVFMATPSMIPASFGSSGWVWGPLFLFYSSFITYQTGLILGKICIANPKLDSYPKITEHVFRLLAGEKASERKRYAWGKYGKWTVITLQCTTYYLTAVGEMLTCEQLFGQLFSTSGVCQWQWLIVVFFLNLLPFQIPSFNESRWIAVVAGIMLILKLTAFFYEVFLESPWNCEPGPSYGGQNIGTLFKSFTAFAFAFGGHGMYPEEIREMKDVSQWKSVLNWTYAIVVPMYIVVGILGYYSFGSFAKANINVNFPDNAMNTLSLAVQLFLEIYLMLIPNLVVVLQIELALGVNPTIKWGTEKNRVWGMPPVIFRLIFRTLYLGSQLFLAELLLSGEGDIILNVQALSGAVGMTAMTYFLPLLFSNVIFDLKKTSVIYWWNAINFMIGVVIMFAGTYFSVLSLFDASTGFFNGDCKLEYAYSPTDPDDPCYLSGF